MAYYPQPDPDAPYALPLAGRDEQMLREGGHYVPRSDLYLSKGRRSIDPSWYQGIPRAPREVEFYPGEFRIEPDPNDSNDATTGHLVRAMLRKGWSRVQIAHALSLIRNEGGAWLSWQRDPDDTLDRFIEGSSLPSASNPPVSPAPSAPNPPVNEVGNPPLPPPEEDAGKPPETVFVPAITELFLAYAVAAPRSRTDFEERGPLRGKRHGKGMAAAYVDHMTEQGLIRWVPGWRVHPRGPIPKFLALVVKPEPEDLVKPGGVVYEF